MSNEYNFLIELIKSLPHWFIMICILVYGLHKFCGNQINIIIRLIAKHNAREERSDRERYNENKQQIELIKTSVEVLNEKDVAHDLRLTSIENTLKNNQSLFKSIEDKIDDVMDYLTRV